MQETEYSHQWVSRETYKASNSAERPLKFEPVWHNCSSSRLKECLFLNGNPQNPTKALIYDRVQCNFHFFYHSKKPINLFILLGQGPQGDMESFDNLRKRKPGSTGWCRICKIDCESVEGLELHSQTREHQKMAMEMVLSIKQGNAKKQKL